MNLDELEDWPEEDLWGSDSPIDSAVAQHVNEEGLLNTPSLARDQCSKQSCAFIDNLADFGIEGTLVSGVQTDPRDKNLLLQGHFAVRVGDQVWDWTACQFDPLADVPLVMSYDDWRKVWPELTETTEQSKET